MKSVKFYFMILINKKGLDILMILNLVPSFQDIQKQNFKMKAHFEFFNPAIGEIQWYDDIAVDGSYWVINLF